MSTKQWILNAVRQAKGERMEMPESFLAPFISQFQVEDFMRVLQSIGGQAIRCDEAQLASFLGDLQTEGARLLDVRILDRDQKQSLLNESASALAAIDTLIVESKLGVAENGAVWIAEQDLPHRILPFICQHVVVLLRESNLVSHMHEAYEALERNEGSGYGVFIAGPSKTADIEQSLVIGAHGPRSLVVYLLS